MFLWRNKKKKETKKNLDAHLILSNTKVIFELWWTRIAIVVTEVLLSDEL